MKLTKTAIKHLTLPAKDKPYYKIYRDDDLKGFAVRVTDQGVKTFILDKKINNKLMRTTIGRFGELTVDEARKECQKLIGQYVTGQDPVKEQKAQRQQDSITLRQVLDDYFEVRKFLKPDTKKEYYSVSKDKFGHLLNKPINAITKGMVTKLHAKIGKNSQSSANKAFKILSALFNFAIAHYEDDTGNSLIYDNPVIRLSQTRAWFPKKRRQTKIHIDDLLKWFNAVNKLYDNRIDSIAESVKYFLLLLLFTGLRREEAMSLIWVEYRSKNKEIAKTQHTLDLGKKLIHIPDPKNRQEHWLPLPDYLRECFEIYKEKTKSKYVFPNARGNNYIREPRKVMAQVTDASGVSFTCHDLRRTFATIAESLDISAYALKRLLNHKIANSDVTAGYIVIDVERLRNPIEKISNYILKVTKLNHAEK